MKKWVIIFCYCLLNSVFAQFQNIRVNSDTLNVCNEPSIALNPTNPNNLVIGVNNTYFFSSFDAGESWTEGKMYSSMGVWGDPSLAFDLNGNCFFAHLSGEPPISGRWADRIVIQKSTDGGLTWNDGTFTGLNRPKFEDKEWLTVDLTSSSYQNNIYTAWTEFDSLFVADTNFKSRELFSRSTDEGETWSTPIKLNEIDGDCQDDDNTIQGATPAIGPEGELYMAWAGPEGILFDRSFDGGVTFGDDIFVSEHVGGWGWGNDIPGIYGNGLPQTICDVSNSSNRGTVYIIWADQRNGITNTDIFLIKSTDHGSTWSNVKRVNDDNTYRPQFYPWMSIDPITGIMYIVYYDRRSTISTMTEVYVARSTDGGESFYNFKISESPFETTLQKFLGDYINIVAYNGKAYPVWTRSDQFGRSIMIAMIDESTLSAENEELVTTYYLYQNYPNPFNPITSIQYSICSRQFVTLKVYDVLGNQIATLVNEELPAGEYEVEFNTSSINHQPSSGIYFYQLKSGSFVETKKMVLLK
ncbi:MAG: T9SS type A sorting domain-containing protein [Ignavibacteriaceae bacterium]|nr:T9SS type A sorting domain-containing protein [Ignavibacteriaceae bacterium]